MALAPVKVVGTPVATKSVDNRVITVPSGQSVPAGNLCVVFASLCNIGTAATFTLTSSISGNTWTKFGEYGSVDTARCAIFYSVLTNTLTALATITITASEFGNMAVSAGEWSGCTVTVDQSSSVEQTTANTAPTRTTSDTTNADDLVLGLITVNGPTADTFTRLAGLHDKIVADSGTSLKASTTGGSAGSNINLNPLWKIVSATGAQTISATITSRTWDVGIVVLQATVTAAQVPYTRSPLWSSLIAQPRGSR